MPSIWIKDGPSADLWKLLTKQPGSINGLRVFRFTEKLDRIIFHPSNDWSLRMWLIFAIKWWRHSSSLSGHDSLLLDVDLFNCSPSRSIFGYLHPAPVSRPAQIVIPPGLRASYTTFTETRSPLQNSFTSTVVGFTADLASHCHFSVLIRCAM
jgi:hypothetical protein